MSILQEIYHWLKPKTINCTSDTQTRTQNMQFQDGHDSPELSEKKICPFQQLYLPMQFVTHPQLIKGFKFQFVKTHSPFFQTFHTWQIPNSDTTEQNSNQMMMMMMGNAPQKPTYTFMGQLVQDVRDHQPYTIMVGKLDTERKLQAMFVRKLWKNLSLKLTYSFQSSNVRQGLSSCQLIYEDKNCCGQLKLLQQYQQFSFTQQLHKNFMFSFDYVNLVLQKMSGWSFGMKAFIKNHTLFSNYLALQGQYNLGYKIPIRKDIKFAANYNYNAHESSSTTSLGFQKKFVDTQITATINTKGQMTTSICLKHLIFFIKLSAFADYKKEKYSFGYGLSMFG